MWRRGLAPWMRHDLSIEEWARLAMERREREEAEPPPVRHRTVYEIVEDDVVDPFVRRFIAEYLIRLGNCEHASQLGFIMDSWSKRNGKCPREITRFLSVHEPFDHIEVKISYLKNARFATANGCYGIRGLVLRWDIAIWSLLREIECAPCANPFGFPNCARLSGIISELRFRPEASIVSQSICRASVAVQYAMSLFYSYDHSGSVPRYLRSLLQDITEVTDRIRHAIEMSSLPVTPDDLVVISEVLPECIAQRLGVPHHPRIFLSDKYYDHLEAVVESLFDRFCQCKECGMRRTERVVAVRARSLGDVRGFTARHDGLLLCKRKKKRNRFFEENDVGLSFCPDVGRLKLPRIRHLDLVQQELLCRHVGRDLMFNCIFGDCRGLSRIRGVPIPFCSSEGLDLDLGYLLYLISNAYFLAFLIRYVRDVMRLEERNYTELVVALVREAARTLSRDVDARVAAGAEPPRQMKVEDVRDPDLSEEERDLGIVRILEGLTFQGIDVVEHVYAPGNVVPRYFGGFCRDAALYLDAVDAYRVPKALREHRARGEIVAHVLGIKRMYEECALPEYSGDKLVPYHLFVSGQWRRDAWIIRGRNVSLMDDEIARISRDEDLFTGHASFYERFDELGLIREVPVKKRTFMMELQRMYVSKSELSASSSSSLSVDEGATSASVVDVERTDDNDGGENEENGERRDGRDDATDPGARDNSNDDDDDYEWEDEPELRPEEFEEDVYERLLMYRQHLDPGRIEDGVDSDDGNDGGLGSETNDDNSSDDDTSAAGLRYVIERLDDPLPRT